MIIILIQLFEYVGIAAFIILFTSGPPFYSKDLKVTIAFYFNFLSVICFLIGVTKFFTCEFK